MADEIDLTTLLEALDDKVKTELASTPTVEDWNGTLDVSTLPIEARKWIKVRGNVWDRIRVVGGAGAAASGLVGAGRVQRAGCVGGWRIGAAVAA